MTAGEKEELGAIRSFKVSKDISHKNIAFFKGQHDHGIEETCHTEKVVMKCCMIHPEN